MFEFLKDRKTYKPIGYNPTNGYRKTDLKYRLIPPTEPSVPAFYGLPKVHKVEPTSLRPIISSIGSVTYNLAKHAVKLIGPLVG